MSATNSTLPGSVPGEFPLTPGEGEKDYSRDLPPGGGAAGSIETVAVRKEPTLGRPAASGITQTTATDSATATEPNIAQPSFAESERPLDEDHGHLARDTAIGGGVAAGAGAVGYGAYEATHEKDNVTSQQSVEQPATGGSHQSDVANKIDPRETETNQTKTEETETHYGRDAAVVGGAAAVAGGAGYGAYELSKDDTEYRAYDRAGQGEPATEKELESKFASYNYNDPNPEKTAEMKEKTRIIEQRKASLPRDDTPRKSSLPRDETTQDSSTAGEAAAVGGAAAAGGVGAAALAGPALDSSDWGPYDRAGKGVVATDGELENKFATYHLNDPNPERTEAMKEKIRKLEEEKAIALGQSPEPPGEKKGFLSKILGKKDGSSSSEGRRRSSATPSNDGVRRSSATGSVEDGRRTSATPTVPDEEHIVLASHDSHPDAPTLVVKESPDHV